MKKAVRIILWVLAALAAVYILLLVSAPVFYSGFYKISEKQVTIPGLSEGFVPQGVSRVEDQGLTVICGYMPGEENSRLYFIDENTDKAVLVKLLREDGSAYTGHAGGLTVQGDRIYLSNNRKIFVMSTDEALKVKDGDTLKFEGFFDVQCRSSFCSSDKDFLYVGEYFAEGYETEEGHRVESLDGDHNALVFAYEFGEGPFGIRDETLPNFCLSTRDEVQGFAVGSNGHAFLSCSASLHDSHIYEYDLSKATVSSYDFNGSSIPMYVLDKRSLVSDTRLPHMSEDLEIMSDGRMLINFEAGAKKFGRGLLPFTVKSVMAMDVKAAGSSDAVTKFKGETSKADAGETAETADQNVAIDTPAVETVADYDGFTFVTKDRDGNEFTESIFADHEITMINFWEPWCGPCIREMPDIQKLYENYCDLGLLVVGVYADTSYESDVDEILKSAGTTYPILLDSHDFDRFRTPYVPTTVFIDRNGHVAVPPSDAAYKEGEVIIGSNSYEVWESVILSLLGEE